MKSNRNPSIQCSVCGKWMRLHGVDKQGVAIQRFYPCCGEHGEFEHEKEVCNECCETKCPYKKIATMTTFEGLKTEIKASMLIMPPNDDYKKGYNEAMLKALRFIERYEKGEGLFQIEPNRQ